MIKSTFPITTSPEGPKPDFIDPDFYTGKEYSLPSPSDRLVEENFTKLSLQRRSRRAYSKATMTRKQLSYLLYYAYHEEDGHLPVPSGANSKSLRLYVCIFNVLDMEKGIYKYHPRRHSLFLVRRFLDATEEIDKIFLGQAFIQKASCLIALGIHLPSSSYKYPSEGEKLSLLEAGHVGQQIQLASESLMLASCPVAKYRQETIDQFFQSEETPIAYVFPVGTRESNF